MKKRTAFIGAILSLIPLGQPLIIKTGVFLSTTGLMLVIPEKVNANSAVSYAISAKNFFDKGDFANALNDLNKAIELQSNNGIAFLNRGIVKEMLRDVDGACEDWQIASNLGISKGRDYFINNCE